MAQTTDEAALREALADGPITVYCGFDPTAPSLHIGNLVQLHPRCATSSAPATGSLCLVGGSTGLIGDPKPTAERVLNDHGAGRRVGGRIQQQVRPFLDFEGDNAAIMVNNLDWTAPLSAMDFLRDIGKHFRVNRMISKDAVAARLASDDGHQLHRVQLPDPAGAGLPAALPRVRLHAADRRQDQWGNLTAGVDLIHRVEGASVHAADHAADHQGRRHQVRQDARATPSGWTPR